MELDFIGLGTQKAGTTTLHDILRQRPDVYLPKTKEAHFFDRKERYEKGMSWLGEFFFEGKKEGQILGKFTPDYLFMPNVPERMNETLTKDEKFIVVLRHFQKR